MLEIELTQPDDFRKIRETLTRMGIASNKEKTLYQSCHILSKQGKYYIVHFKELLKFDGLVVNITEEDMLRRNTIAQCLEKWNLCKILNKSLHKFDDKNYFRLLSHKDKANWKLVSKYTHL